MTNQQQAHTIAAVGTALFLLLLFLLLWFVYVGAPVQEEDEGIEIAFGEMTETQSYASAAEATELVAPQAVTAPSEPAVPTHNDLMTQDDEESLELARNPVPGHGTIGGSSWTLAGRGVKTLPKPSTDFTQEGKVIVAIWVDADGNVIDAQVQGGTVSDKKTQELARKAALKAKFTPAEDGTTKAKGTITYTFKFN